MLIDTVRKTIRDHDLLRKGDHVVLGLSGGPDSVCLFHVLQRLASEMALTIHPVHVNHQFRPGAAERDQAYTETLCAKAGLSCRTFVLDVNTMAKEQGMTSEEAGRKARYDAFVQVAREAAQTAEAAQVAQAADVSVCVDADPVAVAGQVSGTKDSVPAAVSPAAAASPAPAAERPAAAASPAGALRVCIAVAQNANDQAETILHRILRGTGTDGLSGIAYKRYEREIPVIRPLLDVPRSEIEAYCEENGLDPVIDHTNSEPIYTRNRIRLQLLPRLEEYNPNIVETLARLARIASADKEYLWQETEAAYQRLRESAADGREIAAAGVKSAADGAARAVVLDRAGLAKLPAAIRHRVIARAFSEVGLTSDISEERLRAADAIILKKQAPKTVQFPRGHRLGVAKGLVTFS